MTAGPAIKGRLASYRRPEKIATVDITSQAGKAMAERVGIDVAPTFVRLYSDQVVARVVGRLPRRHEWLTLLEAPSDA